MSRSIKSKICCYLKLAMIECKTTAAPFGAEDKCLSEYSHIHIINALQIKYITSTIIVFNDVIKKVMWCANDIGVACINNYSY